MPAAAQEHTADGAAAMVAYYGQLMVHAGMSGDAGPLAALATPDCSACHSVEREASHGLHAADLHVVATQPATAVDASQDVVVYATHDVTLRISSGGHTRTDVVADPAPWRLHLLRTDDGWRVVDIGQVDHLPVPSNG